MSANQAAARRDNSERTVRRRIPAGLLGSDEQDRTFRVSLEDACIIAAAGRGSAAGDGRSADVAQVPHAEGATRDVAALRPAVPPPDAGIAQAVADLAHAVDGLERLIATQRETIGTLTAQLEARTREVQELSGLLQAAEARALPPERQDAPTSPGPVVTPAPAVVPRPSRRLPRWRRWLGQLLLGNSGSR